MARATGRTDELRIRKLKRTVSEKHTQMLVVLDGGLVLLREVVAICRWRHGPAGEALMRAATVLGDVEGMQTLLPLMQVFTHYKLHIKSYRVALADSGRRALLPGCGWYHMANIEQAALSWSVKKMLAQLAV